MSLLPGIAHAQQPRFQNAPLAQEAFKHYQELRLEEALALFQRAAGAPALKDPTRALILAYAGMTAFVLGREPLAQQLFEQALKHDPRVVLPVGEAAPEVMRLLERARGEVVRSDAPVKVAPPLVPAPPTQAEPPRVTISPAPASPAAEPAPVLQPQAAAPEPAPSRWPIALAVGGGAAAAVAAAVIVFFVVSAPACRSAADKGCVDIQLHGVP